MKKRKLSQTQISMESNIMIVKCASVQNEMWCANQVMGFLEKLFPNYNTDILIAFLYSIRQTNSMNEK